MNKSDVDFYTAVGFGLLAGCRRITALGNNPDIDQASLPEDIWSGGGLYPWKTSATTMEAISVSANDAAAGTGARTILVNGLDANYDEISETVTLNGTNAVAMTKTYLRINSALIMSAGSGKTNDGDISIRDSGGGTVRSIIPAGYGITRQASYTVPAGHTLAIHSQLFNILRGSGLAVDVTIANFIQSPNGFYRMPLEIDVDGNPYRHDGVPAIMVSEKNDYTLRCTAASSSTDTNVTGAWLGILVKNSQIPFL